MALTIAYREVDGVTVLDLDGRIILVEGCAELRNAVFALIGKGTKSILLNMAVVSHVDSAGLGELVNAFTVARVQAAKLKLLNPSAKVRDLLQLTRVYTLVEVFDDEPKAIASFQS